MSSVLNAPASRRNVVRAGAWAAPVVVAEGYGFSPANVGSDRTKDSNPNLSGKYTFTIPATATTPFLYDIDAGLVKLP